MYRKDTLVTYGSDLVLLVCQERDDESIGLENFRIFSKSDSEVEVGYTLKNVRAPVLADWRKSRFHPKLIYRTYYLLDLSQRKLFRVNTVNLWACFPACFAKKAIILAKHQEAQFSIRERNGELRVCGNADDARLNTTRLWINEQDMPEAIHVADFKTREVQRVQRVIFLN